VFETDLTELGIDLIRPTRSKEKARPGQEFLKPLRQIIERLSLGSWDLRWGPPRSV
jgi:hypothetical protein